MVAHEDIIKNISGIRFSVFSPTEIRKYSAVEITVPETYDEDGMPVQGGLMDNRLGVLEPGQKCGTCGNTSARCPGHFGHIELAEPVLHVAFVDIIHTLLVSTCRTCGRILLPEDDLKAYEEKLKKEGPTTPGLREKVAKQIVAKAKKAKLCPHCGAKKLDIEFTKPHMFHEITEDGGAIRLLPSAIRERLERITNEDYELLGYNPRASRPEWLVLQVLPVPPVAVRPSITLETGIRSEDDLTHKLVDILRVNQRVRESKESGTPPLIVQDLVDLLQYHVTTYFDNEVSGIPQAHHRSGRPLKTLSQRLRGKEGRFRGNLSGKRVDFSSRTVISPDPSLDISEVGVPVEVAKKLTVPEKVAPWNIEFLRQLVRNGPNVHPGANYVIRPDGVKIRLEYAADREALSEALSPGYMVERHLMDGDIVLFNRQPSLHRMSIMAHFVKVLPYRTFRLHPAVCPPYNADFDGDEMNLHVPQGEEARSEAIMLMRVQDQIISPRYGGPIIGAIRDYLTAAFLLTKPEMYLTREEFSALAYLGGYKGPLPEPELKGPKPLYTGRQLFSLFLPKGFNYVLTSKWAKSSGGVRNDVIVKDGKLVNGVVDKASIGAEEPDTILHRVTKDYGTEVSKQFLNSVLAVLKNYITKQGFTYGFDELELPKEALDEIRRIIDEAYERVKEWIRKYRDGTLPTIRGMKPQEVLEYHIMGELSTAREEAGKVVEKYLSETNAGLVMARTGARGSTLNLGQMMATLGQQSVRGKRIKRGYYRRALPHFKRGDEMPDAYGFVRSSFRDGLSPIEFFFHAMGGREGLVDTAVRTQQSGYMQRRLVNAMEHLRVEYDLTVRDPEGNIIQFMYGEDGIDPAKSDHGKAVNIERLAEAEALVDDPSLPRIKDEEIDKLLKKYEKQLNPKIVEELRSMLKRGRYSQKAAKRLTEKVVQGVKKATVEPGEAIGVVAAQSIGEPGTQMTLRTFHFAGVKERDVTLGLPRLIELVDARKQPSTPTMDIYLDEEHRVSKDRAMEVARELLFTKVEDVIESAEIDFLAQGVTFVLSEDKMKERNVNIQDVAKVLSGGRRKVQVDEEGRRITVVLGTMDLNALQSFRKKAMNTRVKGVPNINRISVIRKEGEWIIQTSGSNLPKVLKVPGIDPARTTTNNIYEIVMTLGIEAARTALVREIVETLNEQGLEVDIRHVLLVADLMTSKGVLQQIGRHGIAGSKTSVLARAAFEITVPTLAEAAVKGEMEQLRGVTENVIVGSTIPIGTGMVELYIKSSEEE